MGGINLAEAAVITYGDETLATTDHTWTGTTASMVAAVALAFPNLCYLTSASKFDLADADAVGTTEGLLAVTTATIAQNATGVFLLRGFIRDDTWSALTIGAPVYVSTTAGGITQTAPSGSGDQVRKIGYAISATVIYFDPDATIVEVV